MEWTTKNRTTITHTTGLTIEVQEGSFSEPYRIHVTGGDSLGAIEQVSLVSAGMKYGAATESDPEVQYNTTAPLEIPKEASPKVIYKRRARRVIPGTSVDGSSATQ